MPAKKPDSETAETAETAATAPAEATERTPIMEIPATDPPSALPSAEPERVECVVLHGRLTHEGTACAAGESLLLPAGLARGLIAAGHVARKE